MYACILTHGFHGPSCYGLPKERLASTELYFSVSEYRHAAVFVSFMSNIANRGVLIGAIKFCIDIKWIFPQRSVCVVHQAWPNEIRLKYCHVSITLAISSTIFVKDIRVLWLLTALIDSIRLHILAFSQPWHSVKMLYCFQSISICHM